VVCGWMTQGFVRAAFTVRYVLQLCAHVEADDDSQWSNPFALNTPYSASVEYFMLVHFFTKFLDFGDTGFFVLKKSWRQLSFLHLYHHR
jgi:hypothetical protein